MRRVSKRSAILIHFAEIIVDAECGAALLRGAHLYAIGIIGMDEGGKSDEDRELFSTFSR